MLLRCYHLLKQMCLCWTTLIEQFIVYLAVLAQRKFSFLDPCLTCMPGLSVCINERLDGFVRSFSRSFSWAAMLSCAVRC